MAQLIEVNGQTIEFPDGMAVGDIEAALKKNMLSIPTKKPETSFAKNMMQHGGNLLAGAVRGAGSIGATLISPFDTATENKDRRQSMDDALKSFGAEPDSNMYGMGKIGAEIAGTAGAGGALARGAMMAPAAARFAPLLESIGSGGISSGGLAGAKAFANRAIGGGISGGLQAGMINPSDAMMGAGIGAALPGVIQAAGKVGQGLYSGAKNMAPNSGQMLADMLGLSADDLPRVIAAARQAPDEIIPGSKLTLNQALQLQGAGDPNIKLLERIAAGGPGGNSLLKRYADQSAARMSMLEANGAQTYQGAAAEEASKAGNKIGSILRTQAADDMGSARSAWEKVYARGANEGVALQLPIEAMNAAMGPLGRGSVMTGSNARRVLATADDIGHPVIGDAPGAEKMLQAVPFDEFQRLRRDSGKLAARAMDRPDTAVEGGVLSNFQGLLSSRADDAAAGNLLAGERMTPEFMAQYNSAREMTKRNAELYKGGNNIAQVLRKPVGQNYTLNGDEITNKLWHGGSGLLGDVQNLKQVLSATNDRPVMDTFQKMIMTDAASKVTAAGDLASGFPRYVENRLPGLGEALTGDQFKAVTGVAKDIRNADSAAEVKGLLGSDTYAKLSRSMDGGLLDAPIAKTLSGLLSFKGIGAETLRAKGAEAVMAYKGKTISELLANPKMAAQALESAKFIETLNPDQINRLQVAASRSVPQLATD